MSTHQPGIETRSRNGRSCILRRRSSALNRSSRHRTTNSEPSPRGQIDGALSDLVENQDLVEGTLRDWIVGYIVKQLVDAGVVGHSQR
jgi:hypothetical protein